MRSIDVNFGGKISQPQQLFSTSALHLIVTSCIGTPMLLSAPSSAAAAAHPSMSMTVFWPPVDSVAGALRSGVTSTSHTAMVAVVTVDSPRRLKPAAFVNDADHESTPISSSADWRNAVDILRRHSTVGLRGANGARCDDAGGRGPPTNSWPAAPYPGR